MAHIAHALLLGALMSAVCTMFMLVLWRTLGRDRPARLHHYWFLETNQLWGMNRATRFWFGTVFAVAVYGLVRIAMDGADILAGW